ncbi:P-loop containing nucleoside triphosphate hydrolase protein [Dactylonectria estremocensis]|uniref:P-loop containing nucleoside triphosphate hydrolase protein n=1 Tax=Dactylonectria estremocensis TaxID=1079267 RepID=A0A9P9DZ25_9HYPO|nr:P-loop containing nucleoside triphosphate hydrolase protein [Dactylonectria estremocensis]
MSLDPKDKRQDATSNIFMSQFLPLAKSQQKLRVATSTTNVCLDEVDPVRVQIRDLGVELNTRSSYSGLVTYLNRFSSRFTNRPPKQLLRSVSADFKPSLTAIIGASGSGKTTLLDALSDRLTGQARVNQGTALFNDRPGVNNIEHAYVTQQDILLPSLTVRETLRYSADLRLPLSTTQQRHAIVEEVITELGLQKCADTKIGNSQNRGCSGGEKRRVSIGVQLLANPSLLCLDEPTTGLDAASAFQLATTLRKVSQKNRIVVMTIHQPRPEIWSLFDNVIVLADGGAVYSGPVCDSIPWFKMNGFDKPPFVNPADFIIDTSAINYRCSRSENESRARVKILKAAWFKDSQRHFLTLPRPECSQRLESSRRQGSQHTSHSRQIRVLINRTIKVTYRDPLGMMSLITEAVLMGLSVGYMFYDLGRDQTGIRSRLGCLYATASLQGYLILIFETYRMTLDMPVFDREALENCVSPSAFLFSRHVARLLTEDLPTPIIFSTLVYFLSGFDCEARKFMIFLTITVVNHYIAVLCATMCVVISRNFATASLIASLIYTLQSLASGMIVQVDTIPVYVRWTRWITYTFYTFSAYVGNEFQGESYDCPPSESQSSHKCIQYTGDFVIKSLGFPDNWTGHAIAYMVGFAVFFASFSILGLTYLKPTSIANARPPKPRKQPSVDEDLHGQRPIAKLQSIPVELQQFSLTLSKKTFQTITKGPTEKLLLEPLDARFEPGVLNVILGPSRSGKSSLLNAIAGRLHNSFSTKYYQHGEILFNGMLQPNGVNPRSICSYVHQDGELLLPAMTVRETLHYAAILRLPRSLSMKARKDRAEEILLKMGLKNCADTLIGSESFRGISGGERRRVSLAIQILRDPNVLLVDEPTSGLDAFTANSIIQILQDLAQEGRTIIVAIHQPHSDLFLYFGNILLLSRGGSPVYSGLAKHMTGYLAACGYTCPVQTNPADFALDMATDLYQHDNEGEASRARVQGLIELWRWRSATSKLISSESVRILSSLVETRPPHESSLSRPTPLRISLPVLVRRALTNTCRQPQLIISRIMQACGITIIFTLFFAGLADDYISIQTRLGFFQQLGGFYIVGMLTNAAIYPEERDVAYREIEDGAYSATSFLASYTIVELLFTIINSFFFGTLSVFAVGLPHTPATFFVLTLACFSGLSCGESLGIMFNTLFSHTGFAINLMGVFLALANSMAGVLSLDMPSLFEAMNYLSPIRYQVRGVAYYSMRTLLFKCNFHDESCPISTGNEALKLYKFDEEPVASIIGMAACVVTYRILAWTLLKVSKM